MFNYWDNLFLSLVETYFLAHDGYVSLKRATASVSEVRFCLTSQQISHLFKYQNGGVGPKKFIV